MRILVWVSGGVDSAVSAYLLKQQWHSVVAGFMLNYLDEQSDTCSTKEDLQSFRQICDYLELPYEILDFRDEYEKRVLTYIYDWYLAGITPNPDVLCNTEIKFKLFLDEALRIGFDAIATGHYAQIINNQKLYDLYRAVDIQKDQSYFLAGLNQFQLSHSLFPIGWLLKTEVRYMADVIWLPNAKRKDSQGLCFVWNVAMSEFLKKKIGKRPWDIILKDGSKVGTHDGAYQFTIGQRKGIGLHFQAYICDIDVQSNTVIVTQDPDDTILMRNVFPLKYVHWISDKLSVPAYNIYCKLRYRQELQLCNIVLQWDSYVVQTKEFQKWVPNGQICVLYANDWRVIASGEIAQH